jgi:hypothetical protein
MRILCRVRSTAGAEICSSTTAPCVVLPPASMQSCNLCIHAIHGVNAGGTTPWTGEVERVGNTRSRAMPPQGWSKDRAIAECVPFTNKNCAYLFRRQTVRTAYPTKIAMIWNNPPSEIPAFGLLRRERDAVQPNIVTVFLLPRLGMQNLPYLLDRRIDL